MLLKMQESWGGVPLPGVLGVEGSLLRCWD